jgi:bifunctional DNA-binding transcriptional regulator/antitoxin component of YhaV-PrlF toxin-antitoxin module
LQRIASGAQYNDDSDAPNSDDSKDLSMKIVENNGQYKITLPKDLVLDKGWKAGDEIRFVEDTEGRIFLKVVSSQKSDDGRHSRK